MNDLSRDPIINVVQKGIKHDIRVLLENNGPRGAILLIYSGIDTMAFLGMPANQESVTQKDFVFWAERYIRLPGPNQLSGLDLYGARCGLLHNYSVYSTLSRMGNCRMIGYTDSMDTPRLYDPKISTGLLIVSIHTLAEAFFRGIDNFLVELFADPQTAATANQRFQRIIHVIPANQGGTPGDPV